jgi:hypothetical protein
VTNRVTVEGIPVARKSEKYCAGIQRYLYRASNFFLYALFLPFPDENN